MQKRNSDLFFRILIALVALAIPAVIIAGVLGIKQAPKAPDPIRVPTKETKVEYVEVEKQVQVEKVITARILQDGLRDMGTLITGEYFFTEVADYSSCVTWNLFDLLKIDVPGSESSFVISYDGTVTAGLDFEKISVAKDLATNTVTVTVPRCEIQAVNIDLDSFRLHAEKESVINRISVADYNSSLVELENTARQHALERGLLEAADKNAAAVITRFVQSLLGTDEYTIVLKTA